MGVNGVSRASLDVEGVSVDMVGDSFLVLRRLLLFVLALVFVTVSEVVLVVGVVGDDPLVVVVEGVRSVWGRGELGLINPGKLAKTRGVVDAS